MVIGDESMAMWEIYDAGGRGINLLSGNTVARHGQLFGKSNTVSERSSMISISLQIKNSTSICEKAQSRQLVRAFGRS